MFCCAKLQNRRFCAQKRILTIPPNLPLIREAFFVRKCFVVQKVQNRRFCAQKRILTIPPNLPLRRCRFCCCASAKSACGLCARLAPQLKREACFVRKCFVVQEVQNRRFCAKKRIYYIPLNPPCERGTFCMEMFCCAGSSKSEILRTKKDIDNPTKPPFTTMSFLLLRLGKIRLRPLRSACTAVDKGGFFVFAL